MAKNWNYIYPSNTAATTGTCVCVHENRVLIGGHANNEDGGYNQIRYSDVGYPCQGYDNEDNNVNVGSSDQAIRFMFDIQGGLMVIKDNSVWMKRTVDETGIWSEQFELLFAGFSKTRAANLFDGMLFLLTYDGLLYFDGNTFQNLSAPLFAEWQTATDTWSLGYWRAMKWVFCNNITTGISYIFDMNNKRWMVDATARKFFAVGNPSGKCIYTDTTNQPKYINQNSYKAAVGTVFFPFTNLGTPYVEKYLKRLFINFSTPTGGSLTVYVYGRNAVGETPTTLINGTVMTAAGTLNNPPNTPFKEIAIKLVSSAHGVMIFPPAIEYDERRL